MTESVCYNSDMDLRLISQHTSEVLGLDELEAYKNDLASLKSYIGFEISGLVHLGTGLSCMMKVRDLQKLGVQTHILLADWHTWINDKLEGDREFIREVAEEYFKKAMQISLQIVGGDPTKTKFILGSHLYHNNDEYWQSVVEISKNLTLSRVLKSTSIMGREDRPNQPFAWLMYPPMQIADAMMIGTHIVQAGMDQRKIHVIAREVAPKLTIKPLRNPSGEVMKPIAVHTPLLMGLQKPSTKVGDTTEAKEIIRTEMKMSKSVSNSAIFIHDTEDEIREKIKAAYCPEKQLELNPIIDWVRNLIFPLKHEIYIQRPDKFGGNYATANIQEFEDRYAAGDIHPVDLKNCVSEILIELLAPARKTFSDKSSQELIERIKDVKNKR